MSNILEKTTVVDFSTRLPGPMATMYLKHFGANVIKVESTTHPDPFIDDVSKEFFPYFNNWYKSINEDKEIIQTDFKDDTLLKEILDKADCLIIPDSNFFNKLIERLGINCPVVKIASSKNADLALHDINAIAQTKNFQTHLKSGHELPYLPLAGISFAQYLSTAILAMIVSGKKEVKTFYLEDAATLGLDSLDTLSAPTMLHLGQYPCYQMYKTSDNITLALAAVEEHYWTNLTELLNINLSPLDRFDKTDKSYKILTERFKQYSCNELKEKISGTKVCITFCEL